MNLLDMIESMEAAGITPEQIVAAIKHHHKEKLEVQREGVRERVRKHREKKQPVTDVTEVTRYTLSPLNPPLLSPPAPPLTSPLNPPTPDDDDCLRAISLDSVQEVHRWCEERINPGMPLITAPITAWLGWGADFELDIKPVVERRIARGGQKIRSLAWLNDEIAASIAQRKAPMPEVQTGSGPPGGFNRRPSFEEQDMAEYRARTARKLAELERLEREAQNETAGLQAN